MAEPGPARPDRRHRRLLAAMAVAGGAATAALCAFLPVNVPLRASLAALAVLAWAAVAHAARESMAQPLRGLANVVEALRTGDYGMRGHGGPPGEPVGDLAREVNGLAVTLHGDRLRALEATALLEQLIATVDVAVLAIDGRGLVRLANPAAARLLGAAQAPVGLPAARLGVGELVHSDPGTRVVDEVAGRAGRWQVTHGTFRESGLAQHLLVIADLSRTLREEERAAWRRITRVMGHEVKNTLAPIRSLAGTLETMLRRALPPGSLLDDVLEGLRVIGDRSAALDRFVLQYRRLTSLPPPRPAEVHLPVLLRRVAALGLTGGGAQIVLQVPEGLTANLDADLVEQALLNLVKNAVEAAGEGGHVELVAAAQGRRVVIQVRDDGPGLGNPDNLFVPFFTTKPGGTGIGLVLSRQIAEAHGGRLTLADRPGERGAVATLELPVAPAPPAG